MRDSGNFFAVHPDQIADLWPVLEPHLERFAAETQTTTPDVIRLKAENMEAQLWGFQDEAGDVIGVCATQVYEHRNGRYLNMWVCAGDLAPVIRDGARMIEDWARSIGCVAVEIVGRKGWGRMLPNYVPRAIIFEKDLREIH